MPNTGISIITSTNRPRFIYNIFRNYRNQTGVRKELIIVLNKDSMNIGLYKKIARRYRHVRVFQLPERTSLGACLNFAVRKARHPVIAKFDDDDFYAPLYAKDALLTLRRLRASLVGKSTFFTYFRDKGLLILRHPRMENKRSRRLAGATLCFWKSVFRYAQFPNRSLGEDGGFIWRCRKKGLRVFSGNRYHYCYIRRRNRFSHSWKISNAKLLSQPHKRVAYTKNIRPWVKGILRS